MRKRQFTRVLSCLSIALPFALLLLLTPRPALAQQLIVSWSPNTEPDLAGYLVEYGTAPGTYTGSIDAGRRTSVAIQNLTPGVRYYVSVRAYNLSGLLSARSPEVSAVVPPQNGSWPATDADRDGLSDLWEQVYNVTSANADDDGDGVTNVAEFRAGTDPRLPNTWDFAEGATGIFTTRLALANPGPVPAEGTVDLLTPGGVPVTQHWRVEPKARATILVNAVPGFAATAVSASLRTLRGGIVAERTMTWDGGNGGESAGHTAGAVPGPQNEWYLAEGDAGVFETWLLLSNPNATDASAVVRFLRSDGVTVQRTYRVTAGARLTIRTNDVPGLAGFSFSIRVTADRPIAVERAMYFGFQGRARQGGHGSHAIVKPATMWYFAEGRTGPLFDTYVLIGNPGSSPAHVTVRYLTPWGEARVDRLTIAGGSRTTIYVDALPGLADTDVSVVLSSDVGIVAERSMYWPGKFPSWREGHNVTGITRLGSRWALAEGRAGGSAGHQTYILLMNPGSVDADAVIEFLLPAGASYQTSLRVPARSRVTIAASDIPALRAAGSFGAVVDATQPIAVERAMYWSVGLPWSGGSCETATRIW